MIQHVRSEHDVKRSRVERQPGHVGIHQIDVIKRPSRGSEHPAREITTDGLYAVGVQPPEIEAVAAPDIENTRRRSRTNTDQAKHPPD